MAVENRDAWSCSEPVEGNIGCGQVSQRNSRAGAVTRRFYTAVCSKLGLGGGLGEPSATPKGLCVILENEDNTQE